MPAFIQAENLTKTYRVGKVDVPALRGVSFEVQKGDFVTIVGPSGSGKSTLFYLLGGLTHATTGRLILDGDDVASLSDSERTRMRRKKIGFVFQKFNLLPTLDARSNIDMAQEISGRRAEDAHFDRVCGLLGLEKRMDHKPSEMSGGEQQRVALARALINRPALILADEPTGNLDSKNSVAVLEMLRQANAEFGQTVMMITHNPEAAAYGNRIIHMRDGEIVAPGSIRNGLGTGKFRTLNFRVRKGEDMPAKTAQTTPQRPPHKRIEHNFFLTLTALVVISVFIGFAHTYFLAGMFLSKLPNWMVHVHAALFTSWIVLLAAQVILVVTGRVQWHMRLGVVGMFVAPLMVVAGFATLIAAVRRHFIPPEPLRIVAVADTLSLLIFAGLVLAAFLAKRNAPEHKRLMLLATCIILGPAIDRWPFAFMASNTAFYVVLNSFVVFLVVYDLWSKRSLHRATVWGVILTAASQLLYGPLGHTAFVDRIVIWLQKG